MHFPQDAVITGGVVWLLGGLIIAAISFALTPEFGPFEVAATLVACMAACLVSGLFTYGVARWLLAEPRREAARLLPVELRESEVRSISLGTKLLASFLAIGVVPLLLSAFLVQALAGDVPGLTVRVFAVTAIAGAFSVGLARVLARDITDTARVLCDGLERLASRDLSLPVQVESDDELGSLARACDRVAGSVGDAVARMAQTAERIDAATGDLEEAGLQVTQASERQTAGVLESSAALEAIDRDAKGMTERSEQLQVSVEESSSAIVELGASSEELREMADTLFAQIDQAVPALGQIAESSESITASVGALSDSAGEAHQATHELAVAAEQIDREAAETGRLAGSVVEASERGRDHVVRSDAGMRRVQDAVTGSARALDELGRHVTEISAVVQLIEDVAAESHLLSLNAAIIAAQAGDQGKGFSIVADEVRGLAERVTSRTREISEIIRTVETGTAHARATMDESREAVDGGIELSAGAAGALEEIAQSARQSGERVQEILRAIRGQGTATLAMRSLMEGVSRDVSGIAEAAAAQVQSQREVTAASTSIRDVAQLVHRSAEEQAHGSVTLRSGVDAVEEATRRIDEGLGSQRVASRNALEQVQEVNTRAHENQKAASQVALGVAALAREAEALRAEVERFKLADGDS
ncbi:MAG: hypothetical protein CL910_12305 [Deltaproteobacteria bacterium]|nr:hypothetical protein [Deltaproteobacteria bacterium]